MGMIEVENLTKRYGPLTAVRDISFSVDRGEIVGFLGPNGAGKTTTMRVLTCYLSATEGTARVAGHDIFNEPLEVKKQIGYLPESPPVYRDMRVKTYLDFVAQIKGVPAGERKRRREDVMDRCGLTERANQLIGQLSKGFRQRVGLAQAIIHNPQVIILDEPTSGLDPHQTREVRDLIRELATDRTVILSTHILPEVEMTCNRVMIINRGEIIAVDTPMNLSAKVKGNERVVVEAAGPPDAVEAVIRTVPGVSTVEAADGAAPGAARFMVEAPVQEEFRSSLAAAVVGAGFGLLELRREGLSLEDIFVELTTEEGAAA